MLGAELLDDRLDHEVAVTELFELGDKGQSSEGGVACSLLELPLVDFAHEEMRDSVTRLVAQLRRDFAPDRLDAGLDAELGDAGAHRAQTDHSDPANLHRRRTLDG